VGLFNLSILDFWFESIDADVEKNKEGLIEVTLL